MSKQELTKERILAMKPGREMDILTGVHVMGYKEDKHRQGMVMKDNRSSFPRRYSSDISAAWEVVEKIKEESRVVRFKFNKNLVKFTLLDITPEIICKAALLAVKGR